MRLHDAEVYAATVGGMRITEPAADLALALAITSARRDVALPSDLVVLGEIGLAGEIRRVAGVERRLAEAARLGFTSALVPPDSGVKRGDLRVQEVGDVALVLDNLPSRRPPFLTSARRACTRRAESASARWRAVGTSPVSHLSPTAITECAGAGSAG